jgi:hypothetical protein
MKKKSKLLRNRKFPFIRKELVRLYGAQTAREITQRAQIHYDDGERLCQGASQGEWEHISGTILPTVAVYKALREIDPDRALEQAHGIMMRLCTQVGAVVAGLLRLPGMRDFFMWLLPKMAVRMFGPSCGFQFENFQAGKGILKMDMTDCPYCRYADKLGCPELMGVFCDSDFATYGNLPGIRFQRSQTLGSGGSRCDFRFVRE